MPMTAAVPAGAETVLHGDRRASGLIYRHRAGPDGGQGETNTGRVGRGARGDGAAVLRPQSSTAQPSPTTPRPSAWSSRYEPHRSRFGGLENSPPVSGTSPQDFSILCRVAHWAKANTLTILTRASQSTPAGTKGIRIASTAGRKCMSMNFFCGSVRSEKRRPSRGTARLAFGRKRWRCAARRGSPFTGRRER